MDVMKYTVVQNVSYIKLNDFEVCIPPSILMFKQIFHVLNKFILFLILLIYLCVLV